MTTPPPRTGRRLLQRAFVLAALTLVFLTATASPAAAHPTLLYTTPAAETADPTPPQTIALVFNEAVKVAPGGFTLTGSGGENVALDAPVSGKDGHAVTARLPRMPTGVYTVKWRVIGVDGDLVEGRFRFAVAATINPLANVDSGGSGPSWPVSVYRFTLLAGLTLAAGGMVAQVLIRRARALNPALPAVDTWTSVGAIAAAAASLALAVGVAADSGGLDTIPARVAAIQAAGFILIVIAQAVRRTGFTVAALAVIAVAEAIRAHPNITWPG